MFLGAHMTSVILSIYAHFLFDAGQEAEASCVYPFWWKRRGVPSKARQFTSEAPAMPYRTNIDLPPPVRAHLPSHAQDIYREAFNHAFASHAEDERQEEIAHRIAWAAVKRSYVKVGDRWEPLPHDH